MIRWLLAGACVLGIACSLAGCGADAPHDMSLLTTAQWKEHPGTVDEIGYWISVDFGWPDRHRSCFDLPAALRVTVNGREGAMSYDTGGDCMWDVVYNVGPFLPDEFQAVSVRVLDGDRLLGEATYPDFFPGTLARLASPADGKVRSGDSVTLTLLSPYYGSAYGGYDFAHYYWLDAPDGVPPYYDLAKAYLSSDRASLTIETPDYDTPARTGRAAVLIDPTRFGASTWTDSCMGFTHCEGWPSLALGPIFVEVLP